MEKVSNRKQAVLDVLDEQIKELEDKLKKVQPLIDELSQLKKTRATLLSERSLTGSVRSGTRITMEQIIHAMRELGGGGTVPEIADKVGADQTVVRSHMNRYRDVRYRQNGDGEWALIGTDGDDDEDDEESDED